MNKLVFIENNRPVTDSLTVAETFGKRHDDVLRAIRNLECSEDFRLRNFTETPYIHEQNKQTYTKFLITQDGFSFLVMGFTGAEAARFKEMYISEFNRLREQVLMPSIPRSLPEALRLAADLAEKNEQLERQNIIMAPKADYFDALVDRNLLTNFRDTAKELQIGERSFIAWLINKRYIYRDVKGKLKPYAQFVPDLFNLKEWERNEKADVQTLVTPKGRETFRLLLKAEAS